MPVVIEEPPLPVREARAGEPEAWEVLLARYRLPLYAYVFELVRHEQTALDIVQESFIAAARHIQSLRQDGKFGSWLFNIAHQRCLQHRRRQRPVEVAVDLLDEDLRDLEPGPEELLIRKEQEEDFMRALGQLTVPHRAVLLLHLVEEFPLEEIARITGTRLGTVKSRLHYARQALRELLEENEA
jgi:RNA polymerase sigma-70 factor (ECF subfamily)